MVFLHQLLEIGRLHWQVFWFDCLDECAQEGLHDAFVPPFLGELILLLLGLLLLFCDLAVLLNLAGFLLLFLDDATLNWLLRLLICLFGWFFLYHALWHFAITGVPKRVKQVMLDGDRLAFLVGGLSARLLIDLRYLAGDNHAADRDWQACMRVYNYCLALVVIGEAFCAVYPQHAGPHQVSAVEQERLHALLQEYAQWNRGLRALEAILRKECKQEIQRRKDGLALVASRKEEWRGPS